MKEVRDQVSSVHERQRAESDEDAQVEEISRNGYTVIQDVLTEDELSFLHTGVIEKIYKQQLEEIGGEEKLKEIADEGSAKHLLSYDKFFLNLAIKKKVLAIVNRLLGDYYILYLQNALLVEPKKFNPASSWHRDIAHQHFTSSRPLAVSALHIVDDITPQTGETLVLAGSHLFEEFPSAGFVKKNAGKISARAGSVLVFDSMMYHRSGHNLSGQIRRTISTIYTSPLFRQQICLPTLLDDRYKDDPFLRRFLGYDCQVKEDAYTWRSERIEKGVGTRRSDL